MFVLFCCSRNISYYHC